MLSVLVTARNAAERSVSHFEVGFRTSIRTCTRSASGARNASWKPENLDVSAFQRDRPRAREVHRHGPAARIALGERHIP